MNFKERHKIVHCFDSGVISANEDIFNGDPQGDVIDLSKWRECTWYIIKNAGAVGTATITVLSCDDTTPTTTTAVAFEYRKVQDPDTHGAWTAATASGFTTDAEADVIYEVRITADGLYSTDQYVTMNCAESADGGVDGAIFAILTNPRYVDADPDTSGTSAP